MPDLHPESNIEERGAAPALAGLPHSEWWMSHEHLVHVRLDDRGGRARSSDGFFEDARPRTSREGNLAIVTIRGVMSPEGDYRGGTSTRAMREEFSKLLADDSVKGVLIDITSPGGTVAGTAEAADELSQLAAAKPVTVHASDLLASAAMWLASQAREISAGRTSWIGSIGTLLVVYDWSRLITEFGVDTHVFATGPYKGTGVLGAKLTDQQKLYLQERVELLQTHFSAAVMSGRKIAADALAKVADGRVFGAEQARQLHLVDRVESFAQALARAKQLAATASSAQPSTTTKGKKMADSSTATTTPAQPQAATYLELLEACDGLDPKNAADAQFLCGLQNQAFTAPQATKAWIGELKTRTDAAQKAVQDAAQAKGKIAAGKAFIPGVDALEESSGAGSGAAGSAREQFFSLVDEQVKLGLPRGRAMSQVARRNPDLRQQMIDEANQK